MEKVQPKNKKTLIIAATSVIIVAILASTTLTIANMLKPAPEKDDTARDLENAKNCVVSEGQKSTAGSFVNGSYVPSGTSYTQLIAECAEKHSVSYDKLSEKIGN